jgi:predicted DNA-binding transcriptional regulator AlpA
MQDARTNIADTDPARASLTERIPVVHNKTSEGDRIIYRQDLYRMLGVTSETLRRYLRDNKIPPADIAITQRTVGWRLSTLRAAGINLL